MSIPAHIVASLQNLLTAQQALENALADISEPNKQTVQRVVEIIKKEILLLAEQYPIIKDFSSLPGINIIPAINLLLLLQLEVLRRGRPPHSSQVQLKGSRSMLGTRRASFKRRIGIFFYLYSRSRKYIS
jgi:hypothetical protein